MPSLCLIPDCGHSASQRGYCKKHYSRLQRHGDPLIIVRKTYKDKTCTVEGCPSAAYCRDMCIMHYARNKKNGSPLLKTLYGTVDGVRRLDKNGYARIKMKGHANANPGGWVSEHVYVMSQLLGRALLPGESVHHKNGVRGDNSPDNLELWVRSQPSGQRVTDILAWANEIIARYGAVKEVAA